MWFSSHALNRKFFHKRYTSIELIVAAHYLIANMFRASVGLGGAPMSDIGTPDIRFLFRLAYAPERKPPKSKVVLVDTDKDGILDRDDACPSTPAVRTNDPK